MQTSAPLLASEVAECCRQVLREVELTRVSILASIILSKLGTQKFWGMNTDQILDNLPPEELMIPQQHRGEDCTRLHALLDFATLVQDDGFPDLRMDVSLEDFQLIRRVYVKRLRHANRNRGGA